ncbi:8048_t:CDS:2, partial [Paraglomus occultum]
DGLLFGLTASSSDMSAFNCAGIGRIVPVDRSLSGNGTLNQINNTPNPRLQSVDTVTANNKVLSTVRSSGAINSRVPVAPVLSRSVNWSRISHSPKSDINTLGIPVLWVGL